MHPTFDVSESVVALALRGRMMDTGSHSFVRWALAVSGVLGLICAGIMFPTALGDYGKSGAAANFVVRLPSWAESTGAPPAGTSMLIVGFLCALLLVVGRWPVKICAALAATWFLYAEIVFRPSGPLAQRVEQTFDRTPFDVAALVSAGVLIAVSVLALTTAALQKGPVVVMGETSRRADS